MKIFLSVILFIFPILVFSQIPKCQNEKVELIGMYGEAGEYPSSILDVWSEVSGNLVSLEVKSKGAFSKVSIVLKSDKEIDLSQTDLILKNNKSKKFNLINIIKEQKSPINKIQFKVFFKNIKKEFCYEESVLIIADENDAREVKNDKELK